MADSYGAEALTALVEELKLTKHTEKLAAAGVTTLRSLMALDDGGISALALPKGPTARRPRPRARPRAPPATDASAP